MKKELSSLVFASLLVGVATAACAGSRGEDVVAEEAPQPVAVAEAAEVEETKSYFYLQGGVVYSIENMDFTERYLAGPSTDAENAWGYDVRAGYRFNEMIAAEAQWQHLAGDFDFSQGEKVETWAVTANGRIYPLKGKFQPFALVGIGYNHADIDLPGGGGGFADGGGFAARFGVGLDLLITENIGLSAEVDYLLATGAISKHADQIPLSVGFFYNFL
jgi:opacity protein-like surface antigen